MPGPYDNSNIGTGLEDISGGEGLGLYDLFNQFNYVGTLMSNAQSAETSEGSFGLEAYDPFQENLLREQYRSDYRSMVGDLTQFQRQQKKELAGAASQYGKAGFAGSGQSNVAQSQAQEALAAQSRKMTRGLAGRKDQLFGDIQNQRQGYANELWDVHSLWLQQDPSESDFLSQEAQDQATECYDNGGYVGPNGICVMPTDEGIGGSWSDAELYQEEFQDWMQP